MTMEALKGMKCLAKPIVGIITSRTELIDDVMKRMEVHFGKVDFVGEWRPFDHTSYYEDEMGRDLKRCFFSFDMLVAPHRSKHFKTWTTAIEDFYRINGRRVVNLDAGYVDANKVVLMTGKHGGHKIAVEEGVWADFLLWYNKGWVALPWAFPDFRDGSHFPTFEKMRGRFKAQIRSSQES